MKLVIWTDDQGWKHRSLLRDSDPDEAASIGIPDDPPDLNRLEWDGLVRELHNLLVERGIVTWADVEREQNSITSSILTVFKRPIVALYRLKESEGPPESP